jgi:hypothetical protein
MPIPSNPELYAEVKSHADKVYSKPSAYKSGYIVKLYKKLGGEYLDDKKPKNLKKWFKEKWEDVADLDYPVYRPTVRVNKSTPLIVSEIDRDNLAKQILLKQLLRGEYNLPPFKKK